MKRTIGMLLALSLIAGGAIFWRARSAAHSASARHDHAGEIEARSGKVMYNCAMHPQYISDKPGNCPICGMKLVRMDKEAPGTRGATGDSAGRTRGAVRIDPATVQNMGVRTEIVARRDLAAEVRASGKVKVDESRITIVNARVMGYAEKLIADVTGQPVVKGRPLLELYSPDLVSAQEEYLQAVRYARGAGVAAGAQELVESSRRRLANWGISAAEIDALEKQGKARNTMSIVSPATGVVLEKKVTRGQNVSPGMELYTIGDLSRVWVVANVYQADLGAVRVGNEADVELGYRPGKPFRGKVIFVSPVLDAMTKTAEVRVEVANTRTLDIKPEMFATVILRAAAHKAALAVPEQAIIRSGRRNVAIMAAGGGYFEPREVELGIASGGYVEVTSGLKEGESLVVSSQFLIDSESNLKTAIQQLQAAPAASGAPDSSRSQGGN